MVPFHLLFTPSLILGLLHRLICGVGYVLLLLFPHISILIAMDVSSLQVPLLYSNSSVMVVNLR